MPALLGGSRRNHIRFASRRRFREPPHLTDHPVAPRDKALKVNFDPRHYGTFAEIGAGQEVVRWFFRAGGAAGTIAKSISAYDMTVSDAIYGSCERYVCRERLQSMLELRAAVEPRASRCESRRATRRSSRSPTPCRRGASSGTNECHGWMGITFPGAAARHRTARSSSTYACSTSRTRCSRRRSASSASTSFTARASCTIEPEQLVESLLDGSEHQSHRDRLDRVLRRAFPRTSTTA